MPAPTFPTPVACEPLPQWQLQEAKNRLSAVVKAASQGQPQLVTVHGQAAAVVLSPQDYAALLEAQVPAPRLSEALACPVLADEADVLFKRDAASNPRRGDLF